MTAARVHQLPTAKPSPSIVHVTPEIAERWLAGNTVNRNLRSTAVRQYAADMVAGRWTLTGDALCFAPDGKLLNGQHRLSAIIASGCTVPMLVMRNVAPESMRNMDTGRARTAADTLRFEGEQNATALAAAARLALLYSDGRLYKDHRLRSVSIGELQQFIADHPDLRESVHAISSARVGNVTPTAQVVAHWMFTQTAGAHDATSFFLSLRDLVGLEAGSPILALNSRLRDARQKRTKLTHREELYLLVKGWNYWRTGHHVSKIAAQPKSGEFRIPAVSA